MSALPRRVRCLFPGGCDRAPNGMFCEVHEHTSTRRSPVRAMVLPTAMLPEVAGVMLAAEGDTHDEARLPPPWRCDAHLAALHRARIALRLASLAQVFATQARRVALDGGDLDALCDTHDELGAAVSEGVSWLRAVEEHSRGV